MHCLLGITNGANILFLVPFPAPSQWMLISKIANELLDKGHSITTIGNFPLNRSHLNYTEILISPRFAINPSVSKYKPNPKILY